VQDTRLWNFELEMPFLLLALGFILSIAFWLIGTFTQRFRGRRWKMAVAPLSFALMGLLGLVATVRRVAPVSIPKSMRVPHPSRSCLR
jgi:hypothetical protein